ncbi:integration host factor subunit beta [Methylobacterium sp. WL12]|nr:integration host factor subunit beta [Methylobacterium sp. WL12]
MIRSDLVLRLAAQNPHLYEKDCEAVVDAILGRIADALVAGDRVEIRGFGSFSVKERQAREGRNPKTGAPVSVSAEGALVFKAGREMQRRLNPLGSTPSIPGHPMPDLRVEPREHPRVNSQAEARPERSGIASGRP